MTEVGGRDDQQVASAGPSIGLPAHKEAQADATRAALSSTGSPAWQIVIALGIYVAAWVFTIAWPLVLHPTGESLDQRNMDPDMFLWCVAWWPHALLHGLNPLYSTQVQAPVGQSLAWVVTVPPLAILAAPLTMTAGPVVSFNLLVALGPPVSAAAAFVLCRRLTGKFWPALVGGAVFGFSAYETRASAAGQLNLSYSLLLPILAYLVVVWWQRGISARTYVILCAATITAQFYLFTETFAALTVIALMCLLLGFAFARREDRPVVLRLSRLTAVGYLIALVPVSPAIIYALSSKPLAPTDYTSMDLASFVLPRPGSIPGAAWLTDAASQAHPLSTVGYVGVPLLILAVLLVARSWRNRLVRVLACLLGVILVASLGPVVYLQGRALARVPWAGLYDLPIVRQAWMSRLMVFAFLVLGVATALWLAGPWSRSAWLRWLLAAVIVVNVAIDAFPMATGQVSAVPAFISAGLYRSQLSPGEIVVVVSNDANAGLLWQAQSGYYLRIAGGFFNQGLHYLSDPSSPASDDLPEPVAGLAARDPAAVKRFEAYIKRDKLGAILLDARQEPRWARVFPRLGLVGHLVGDVIVYPTDGCRTCHALQTGS